MKFEDFEKFILDKGYGIVAMNHYSIKGRFYTYCVVLNSNEKKAFKAEAEKSEKVFDELYNQISQVEKNFQTPK